MATYFVHDKNGEYQRLTSPPSSGFYYAQDKPGGAVVLYEANPSGEPKKLDSWDKPNDLDYLVTSDGQAYDTRIVDNVYRIDPDKREEKHDRKPSGPPPPTEADEKKKYMEGLEKDPKEGDKLDQFPLKIKIPPGSASEDLQTFIKLANRQLAYLAYQMGANKGKPLALASPEKGKDTNIWDNNLSKPFLDAIANGALAQAGGTGEAVDEYKKASDFLDELDAQWSTRDNDFKLENEKLTADNDRTYRNMYDKIQSTHEDIWAKLKEPHAGYYGSSTFSDKNFTAPGIQNIVEEKPIYGIVSQAVQYCVDQVTQYANRAESAGKKYGDFPGYPKEEKPATTHTPTNTTTTTPTNTTTTSPTNTTTAPPYNGSPAPTQTAPPEQDMFPTPESNPTLNDLGLGSDSTGSLTDTGTGTQPISATGSTDPSSSSDPFAAIRNALQGNTGTGTNTGTNTGANTGNVVPAANSGDNGMANAMQQMAMMNAMSGMMNQGRQPDEDRLERAYAEREREREREKREERERNRNAQTTTAQQAVQQTSPPGVTAPTYAGAPPAVTTPGGMVDYKIGNSTVQVSQPVAEALHRQTQNTATNAVAAYEGTAGASTADHPWATVNDVAQLKTGDVVQWEKHSALIVKNENGLNILDNGQLIPLDPNNPPLTEKYGSFTGYAHPTGLDVGSNTLDPSAVAPPPPTVSAAVPAGPPPVGPPPQA
ncbi:hypothetical protein [Nocardia asiatica]|uniref:hypothetical protein n=1 Tax=Nocardia asiatica TaxID=209252 RepID=UPI003EE4061B